MKRYCFFNGKNIELKKAGFSPYDLAVLRGYSFFDVMRTVNGKPFLLKEHFLRLKKSAKEMQVAMPFEEKEFEAKVKSLLKINKFKKEATIRTLISGGISLDSFSISASPTVCILAEDFHSFPQSCYEKGAKLLVLENKPYFPKTKIVSNYYGAIKAQRLKNQKRAQEILYIQDGKVFECSTSNIFLIRDKKIITPKEGIVLGVTRDLVLKKIAKGFRIEEREISRQELEEAEEVFLTATSKGIVPVSQIDGKKIADGKIGPVVRKFMEDYEKLLREY